MKNISFSVIEILPSLLDKSKTQTIRSAWKDFSKLPIRLQPIIQYFCKKHNKLITVKKVDSINAYSVLFVCGKCTPLVKFMDRELFDDLSYKKNPFEKPPRFKVGEQVRLLWKQRSRHQTFKRKDGMPLKDVNDIPSAFELYGKNASKLKRPLIDKELGIFNKNLGIVKITEVFKIEMGRENQKFYLRFIDDSTPIRQGKYKFPINAGYARTNDLAKRDGFKSAEKLFQFFDKEYDLSTPKPFGVYRW